MGRASRAKHYAAMASLEPGEEVFGLSEQDVADFRWVLYRSVPARAASDRRRRKSWLAQFGVEPRPPSPGRRCPAAAARRAGTPARCTSGRGGSCRCPRGNDPCPCRGFQPEYNLDRMAGW